MNKSAKRLVSVLLAVLVLSALGASALAEGDTYTITVSTGNIDGAVLVGESVQKAAYGDTVPLGSVSVPEDSPYFFKGFRPAGQDNNVVYPESIRVTEDADYVAAYGLRGDLVAYTVTYRDANGVDLVIDSEPHYGNVGDKIVVGARDIDDYQPQAYQLAKTLSADASQNVFPFVYTPVVVVTPEPVVQPTPYVYTEGAATAPEAAETEEIGGDEAPAGGGEEAVPDAAETEPEAVEPAEAPAQEPVQEPVQEQQTEQITEDETPLNEGPAERIDLDDTPMGDTPEVKEKPKTDMQQERDKTETKLYVAAGLLGVSLVVIAALVVVLVKKRRA